MGEAIFTHNISLNFSGTSNFINNSASGGGAIGTDSNSSLTFNGTIQFTNNGHYWKGVTAGGGVYIGVNSTVSILPNTTVYWENNCATLGGAIYVMDISPLSYCTQFILYVSKQECFFQFPGQTLSNGIDVKLVFKNNSPDDAGSVLYGGAIDNCKLTHGLDSHRSGEMFNMIVHNNETSTQIQTFPLPQLKYALVKTIFRTVVSIVFHTQRILEKCFKFLWLQLDKEMEQFLAK